MRDGNLGTPNFLCALHPELLKRVWDGESVVIPPVPSDVALDNSRLPAGAYRSLFVATPILDDRGQPQAVLTLRFDSRKSVEQVLSAADHLEAVDTFAFDQNLRFVTQARNLGSPWSVSAAGGFFYARVVEPATEAAAARPTAMAQRALSALSEPSGTFGTVRANARRVRDVRRKSRDRGLDVERSPGNGLRQRNR